MLHNNIEHIVKDAQSELLIRIAEDAHRRCLGVTDEHYLTNQQKIVTACMDELTRRAIGKAN